MFSLDLDARSRYLFAVRRINAVLPPEQADDLIADSMFLADELQNGPEYPEEWYHRAANALETHTFLIICGRPTLPLWN